MISTVNFALAFRRAAENRIGSLHPIFIICRFQESNILVSECFDWGPPSSLRDLPGVNRPSLFWFMPYLSPSLAPPLASGYSCKKWLWKTSFAPALLLQLCRSDWTIMSEWKKTRKIKKTQKAKSKKNGGWNSSVRWSASDAAKFSEECSWTIQVSLRTWKHKKTFTLTILPTGGCANKRKGFPTEASILRLLLLFYFAERPYCGTRSCACSTPICHASVIAFICAPSKTVSPAVKPSSGSGTIWSKRKLLERMSPGNKRCCSARSSWHRRYTCNRAWSIVFVSLGLVCLCCPDCWVRKLFSQF